ncbi:MAG: hypothetical protein ACTSPV_16850 [Candidatus Hodarchaeales archaeon]
MRLKKNSLWIISTERKKDTRFAIVTATLLVTIFLLSNFYHVLSYQPFRNLAAELSDNEVILNFGEKNVSNVSLHDIQEIHTYFDENLPGSIISGLKSNISIRGSFDNLGSTLSAFIKGTTLSGQVFSFGTISKDQYENFIQFLMKSLNDSSISNVWDFKGILFAEKLGNFSLFSSNDLIQSVKINRTGDNQEIVVFENNLLIVNLSKYNVTINTDFFPELRSLPQILMTHEKFFQVMRNLLGYFSISISMDFEIDIYLDILFESNLFHSYTDVLVEFQKQMEKSGWISFTSIKDTSIYTYRSLTEQISLIFFFLLIISLTPVFLAGLLILSFVEKARSATFKEKFLSKLRFRGYPNSYLVFFYLLETIMITSIAIILGMISSLFLFVIITWQNKGNIVEINIFQLMTRSLLSSFSPIPLILLVMMLIIVNRDIWMSLFRFNIALSQKNERESENICPRFKLSRIEYIVISFVTISFITSLFIIRAPIDEYNLILGILLVFGISRLWLANGLYVIAIILDYLAEKFEAIILMVSIHKMKLLQKHFCSILFWILLMSFVVPSSIKTITVNSERDEYYQTGADVRIVFDSPLNMTKIENQLLKIPEINSFDIINQTELTLGTEYTLHPEIFEIIGVNPLKFFSYRRFEDQFIGHINVKDVANELAKNGTILIPVSDLTRINSQVDNSLIIEGYSNYTKVSKKEYVLNVIGTVEYWPTRTISSLEDSKIQIFTGIQTFKVITEGWNASISHVGFINFDSKYLSFESYNLVQNLSANVIFNSNLIIENVSITNPYNALSKQIFNIFEIIILDSILLIVIPISIIFFWFISRNLRFMIGVLKTLGLPNRQIKFSLFGYVLILSSFVFIGTGVITIMLFWLVSLFLRTPSGLPLISQFSFDVWIYAFCFLVFSLLLTARRMTRSVSEPPAHLIKTKE